MFLHRPEQPPSYPRVVGNDRSGQPQLREHIRMRHRTELPQRLGSSFGIRQASEAGVTRWRRDTPDLHRPFPGVRSTAAPRTFDEMLSCYQHRMKPDHRYVGRTAVRLWGLPHPTPWVAAEPIEVAVPPDRTPPKTAGVKGRRLARHRGETYGFGGVKVVDPIAAVFSCADDFTVDEMVTVLDALVTPSAEYPGLRPGKPVYTVDDLRAALDAWHPFSGHRIVRSALEQVRVGVDSPKETETRLLIIAAGLPEPVLQHEVYDRRRFIARIDLAYPELKIAIEYEGDGHRSSKEQWRRDIERQRELEDRGWIVIRLTQLDLDKGGGRLLHRIRRAILSRTA